MGSEVPAVDIVAVVSVAVELFLISVSMFKIANDEMLFPVECCLNAPNLNKCSDEKIWWLPLTEFSEKPFPKT